MRLWVGLITAHSIQLFFPFASFALRSFLTFCPPPQLPVTILLSEDTHTDAHTFTSALSDALLLSASTQLQILSAS